VPTFAGLTFAVLIWAKPSSSPRHSSTPLAAIVRRCCHRLPIGRDTGLAVLPSDDPVRASHHAFWDEAHPASGVERSVDAVERRAVPLQRGSAGQLK